MELIESDGTIREPVWVRHRSCAYMLWLCSVGVLVGLLIVRVELFLTLLTFFLTFSSYWLAWLLDSGWLQPLSCFPSFNNPVSPLGVPLSRAVLFPLQIFIRVIGSLVQSCYMDIATTLTINKWQMIKAFEDLILAHPQFPSGLSKKTPQRTILAKNQLKLCFSLEAYLGNTKTSYIWHLFMKGLSLNQNAFSLPSAILFFVTIKKKKYLS